MRGIILFLYVKAVTLKFTLSVEIAGITNKTTPGAVKISKNLFPRERAQGLACKNSVFKRVIGKIIHKNF
ncbi:hypothetical protein AXE75_00040 [Gardnerella vaginalis]|nr:hypothetical protein AXE75_07105 [Gardnerella vaginalis]RFD75775.1 hypothetical protein AXE75_00040 [Gardnerella vaginalis]